MKNLSLNKKIIIVISLVLLVAIVVFVLLNFNLFKKKNTISYERGEITNNSQMISDSSESKTDIESSKNEVSSQNNSRVESSSKQENVTSKKEETSQIRPEKITKIFTVNNNLSMSGVKRDVFYDSKNGISLPYCLYVPENYTPTKEYPVILFLHGAGEIGTDNEEQLKNINNLFKYNSDLISSAFLLCPQTDSWWSLDKYATGDQKGPLGSALHLLQDLQNKYSCDSNRIYVTGLSMGGMATWDLLEQYGDLFAAAIPVCGSGNPNNVSLFKNLPIRIYHGTADATVNFSGSKQMYDAIKNAGGNNVKLYALEGIGHNAWDTAYGDRDTFSWLLAQNKKNNPTSEYEYVNYFKIVDYKGDVIITEKDISDIMYSNSFSGEQTCTIDMFLSNEGKEKLTKAYKSSKGKEFTVFWSTQKLFSFTATTPPTNNLFTMVNILNEKKAASFADMINKFK